MTSIKICIFVSLAALIVTLSGCDSAEVGTNADEKSVDVRVSKAVAKSSCDSASLLTLPDVKITSVTSETQWAPHCKVAGIIGTETRFELLLPDTWNGKFVMGGGGGFVGDVTNQALLFYAPLQEGYATVGTDTGHRGYSIDASWALNNLERVVSYGHQAVHRTAVTAKALTAGFYAKDISRSYFVGCSTGGRQGLMEAQRYPDDFDGIVAGAPANSQTAASLEIIRAMYPDPNQLDEAIIGAKEQALIEAAYFPQCDAMDGLEDGILIDPRKCSLDLSSLACSSQKNEACLSKAQIAAARAIYDGPRDELGQIAPGYPLGGETAVDGWSQWMSGGLKHEVFRNLMLRFGVVLEGEDVPEVPNMKYAFLMGVMKNIIYNDPDWSYVGYDINELRKSRGATAQNYDATNPDLSAFRKRGGKLLMYTGWGDMARTPLGTIDYYEQVLKQDPTAVDDARLFMMPGVNHCFGGAGPDTVDYLDEIDRWVETDNTPDQVTAYWLNEERQPEGSRLACAYPRILTYDGEGDPRKATSFSCSSK
jgi:pimeloyl-ACP methyl ester carboxylesterase